MRPDGEWATLATEKRLRVREGRDASPHDFEKVCFVESVRTDTQAAVWRCVADRTVVISFRGTEMSKPLDVLTDVKILWLPRRAPAGEGGGREDEPRVHGVSSRRTIASSEGSSERWTTSSAPVPVPGARTRRTKGSARFDRTGGTTMGGTCS